MKKHILLHFFILMTFLLIFCTSSAMGNSSKSKWHGRVVTEKNITKIYNPSTPAYGEITLVLEEKLSIGNIKDENCFFYKGFDFDVDRMGNIYILDYGNTQIKIFDKKGKFLHSIGRKGQGPVEFQSPGQIEISHKGEIFITDSNYILKILKEDGEFKSKHIFTTSFKSLVPMDSNNLLFVKNKYIFSDQKNVYILSKVDLNGGTLFDYLSVGFKSMIISGNDKIFVYFPGINPEIYYSLSPNQILYCGINTENCIYKYDNNQKKAEILMSERIPPLSAEEKDKLLKQTYFKYPPNIQNKIKKLLPNNKPCFSALLVDDNEWLYVFKKKESAIDKKSDDFVVNIFNPEGKYFYKTFLRWIPKRIIDDYFWVKVKNSEGDFFLKKFKVKNLRKFVN